MITSESHAILQTPIPAAPSLQKLPKKVSQSKSPPLITSPGPRPVFHGAFPTATYHLPMLATTSLAHSSPAPERSARFFSAPVRIMKAMKLFAACLLLFLTTLCPAPASSLPAPMLGEEE